MIDAGLVSLLAADSGIAAILSTATAAQLAGWTPAAGIFPMAAPEDKDKFPLIECSFVGGSSDPTFETSGVQRARVEINCWAATATVAKNLADAVRKALNGYQGVLSDGTPLLDAQLLNPGTDFFSDASRFFRRMQEFYLLYTFTS